MSGAPVCRSTLQGIDPACRPYDVFTGNAPSEASINYLNVFGVIDGQTSEQIANVNFTGALGEYGVQTPWSDEGVAVNFGVEYRKESLVLNPDQSFQTGDLAGQGAPTLPVDGNFRALEWFAETQIPLVRQSLFEELTLNAGYRSSSYKLSNGRKYSTDTYKFGVEFAPIADVRFRGSYNRASRAPNIQELFAPQFVGLDGANDPCAQEISATDYGCIAQGLKVGQSPTANPAGQYNGLLGGNPNLKPEKATTKTLGVVLQPRFLPRFAATIDYWNIDLKDAIQGFGADAIINNCIEFTTATSVAPSCALIRRDPAVRHARVAQMPAHRGAIVDRFDEPLAVSSPVDTVWVNPPEFAEAGDGIARLARALKRNKQWLAQRVTSNLVRQFLYVARHMDPAEAAKIKALGIPGVYLLREYRRYYPNSEVTGHLLGFTNLDEAGQEGLELAYDPSLAGQDGQKRVIQDGRGRIVQNVESVMAPRPGVDLHTSLDLRIQYLAYRELNAAIRKHGAQAGSVIVIDVATGEVLAMVNQPSFNPNDRAQYEVARYRNRAATDIFEPGSSIKPFVMAAALASGRYRTDSLIDATPFRVANKTIRDKHDLGTIDLSEALARSSNVAMAKIALSLEPVQMHDTLRALCFGEVTASGFPGESAGLMSSADHWRPIGIATMAYGYGLSVTPLQLAQGYASTAPTPRSLSPLRSSASVVWPLTK